MTQKISPFTEVKYGWEFGESGWNSGMDENLLKLSFLFDRNVDGIVNSLPTLVNGQAYFLTTDNRLYFAVQGLWYSSPTPKWFEFAVKTTGEVYRFDGTDIAVVESTENLDSRLDAVELILSQLGSAAYSNVEDFATQSNLDVVSAQANSYTDDLANSLSSSTGANLVGYGASTVGAVLDGVASSANYPVVLSDYAEPSSTDQSANIQALLNSTSGSVIDGGNFTYRVDSQIVIPNSVTLQNATLDFSNAPAGTICISVSGSVVGPFTPTSTLSAGGVSLTLSTTDAANFTSNDYLRYRADNVFDASNTNSKVGEISVVDSVNYSTGVVTLKTPRLDSYTVNQVVEKVQPIKGVVLRNIRVIGAAADQNNMIAAQFRYANSCIVENCEFSRFDSRCVYFLDSVGCHVTGSTFKSARPATSGYGVSFADATQDCTASGNYFESVRHSLSTNNTSARGGVVRRISFIGNNIFHSAPALAGSMGGGDAIDTHGAAQDILISGNTVVGATGQGINVECCGATVTNNRIIGCQSNGIGVHNESDFPALFIISGNTISGAGGHGISVSPPIRGSVVVDKGFSVTNNIVTGCSTIGIWCRSATAIVMQNVNVSGNTIELPGSNGIVIGVARGVVVSNNSVKDTAAASNALLISDTLQFTITGNTVRASSSATVPIVSITASSSGSSSRGLVSSNLLEPQASTTSAAAVSVSNNATYIGVWTNVMRGTAGISLGTGTGNVSANNIT